MKPFVTGAGGLLGSKIAELAFIRGWRVYSAYIFHEPEFGEEVRLNITDSDTVRNVIEDVKPDVIIHCAALTNVDLCEKDKDLALNVNFKSTQFLALASKSVDAYFVYISTDYVFDGLKGMYKEDDEPNPINYYGYTKLLGEKAVSENNPNCLIVRPSVIYGSKPASGKTNFALWIIDELERNREIKVLVDQYVSPTLNTNLAETILEASERRLTGIYHMAGATRVSRYEFAVELARTFNLNSALVKRASMEEMEWLAKRPKDSSLDVSKATRDLRSKPLKLTEALSLLKNEWKNA